MAIPRRLERYLSGPSDSAVAIEKLLAGKLTDGEYSLERHRIAEAHYRSLVARIFEPVA